jgi:hypothetical protein
MRFRVRSLRRSGPKVNPPQAGKLREAHAPEAGESVSDGQSTVLLVRLPERRCQAASGRGDGQSQPEFSQ